MTSSTTMQTVMLKVGLHCEGCERRVKKAIWQLRGVTSVDVDTKQERVTVTGFVDPAKVLKAVKKTGKSVEICNNKYQAGNNKIPYVVTPAKFGNAGGGESKSTPDSKKHGHQQFTNSTKTKQQQPRHTQSDYYSDADSDYGSSLSKVRQSSNKFNGSSNKSSHKDQKSSFKDHSKLQSQYQEEFDFEDFESDEENDFSYGNQKSSFYNPKSSGGAFDNSNNPKSSLKQSAGFPGLGTQKQQSSQADFEYSGSKSPHSGYENNSHSKSQSLYGYVPNNSNEHKSSNKSPYGHASGNNNEQLKSQNKSSYGYAPNTHNEHQNSHSNGNKSQYPASYSDNKPQKKQQQQQKFVTFDDEYEPHQQPKYRPEPQLVKQQRSSNRDDEYGYEQKFYTAYGHEQNYRPTYSYTYHEPNHRIPPATGGFSTMFSEENPNACSIM